MSLKFELRIANVDLIFLVVNANMKVDYIKHVLMTLNTMHCLCPLIPNMVAMYSLVYYFDQSSIKSNCVHLHMVLLLYKSTNLVEL